MRPAVEFTRQSSTSDKMETNPGAPAPELDDHTHRISQMAPNTRSAVNYTPTISPGTRGNVPGVSVHAATPLGSISDNEDLLKVDDALRHAANNPVARDFEQAIEDDSDGDDGLSNRSRFGSARRGARRGTRTRDPMRVSRESSSSRSTSPANSIEAFAPEPRRRQRSNTLDSFGSLADFVQSRQQRGPSFDAGTRRPTISNGVPPVALTHRTDEQIPDDVTVDLDEEPGKTYRIDFEELDEFVALCAQGKFLNDTPMASHRGSQGETEIFDDLRKEKQDFDVINNVALNADTITERAITPHQTRTNTTAPSMADPPKLVSTNDQDPNRFTFFSTEIPQAKKATKIGDLTSEGESFRDLFDLGEEGGVWWLDVLNPTRAELEVITKAFKIHRLTREDIETQESREKVELFSQYYFVSFRSFVPDKMSEYFLDPLHVYIVVTEDGVLSFSYMDNPHARNVRRRITKLGDYVSLGPDYICYAMIDDIVDSFAPIIHEAEMESSNIEDAVFIAREEDYLSLLRQIGECRKKVLNMMRLLGGKADVIKGFAKRCNENFDIAPRGDIGLYLGDIQDHVVTMMSNLVHVEKMLSRSHANYLAQLNVDSILQGTASSKALAKLTVVATIIVPLNIITGLFGMNVHVPGGGGETLYWFFGIVGCMICFVCITMLIARRLKYC